jgi:signal transduction histidine kinase
LLVDGNLNVSKVNQAFIKLFDIQQDKILNRSLINADEKIKRHLSQQQDYKSMLACIEASEIYYKEKQPLPEYIFELDNTTKKTIKRSFIPVNQPDLLGIFYFADITLEYKVEKMKSEFISTAAHELRTPMAIIYGYAELIKTRKLSQDKLSDMINGIWKNTRHVVEMLDDLLDLAIIEQRSANVMVFKTQPIKPFLENIVDHYQYPTNQNPVQLLTVGDLGMYRFDKTKLERAIINCLNNAYKFSSHDAYVELRAEINNQVGQQQMLFISIVDHGIGIKADELPRIFERFYRGDQSGNIAGNGLGLPLVKEIVEAHGGWVEVQSEWLAGTCIKFCLPIEPITVQS